MGACRGFDELQSQNSGAHALLTVDALDAFSA